MNNFFVYDYTPPEMHKGCLAFYEVKTGEIKYYCKKYINFKVWQETLEKEITKRKNDEEIEDKICLKITKVALFSDLKSKIAQACEGVNLEAKRDENQKKSKDVYSHYQKTKKKKKL